MSEELKAAAIKAANRMRDNHKEVCRVMMPHADEPKLWEESTDRANVMARYILSPHAPGPGFDAEGDLPVTEEWLRSVGFTTAPNAAYVRIASKDNAVAVRLATGEVEVYDNESLEMCRVYGVTRSRMRSLCAALGIPLTAPGERNGE